jgi:Fe-S cluster biosynthesis and repair protein YggX
MSAQESSPKHMHVSGRGNVDLKATARGPWPRLPLVPRDLGKRIYANVSKECWQQWVAHQTMLINENRLTPIEPKASGVSGQGNGEVFFGEGSEKPKEFVPKW